MSLRFHPIVCVAVIAVCVLAVAQTAMAQGRVVGTVLDEDGNPRGGMPGFDDRCIIAGFQFTNLWLPKKQWRRYPNLVGTGRGKSRKGNIGNTDFGSVVKLAKDWLADNGLGPYDTNAGRKAYAAMLDKLNIFYEWGFENHGDTYSTWETNYQPGCRRENEDFSRRTQSTTPRVATRALRQISTWMELGNKQPPRQMSLLERQNDMILRGMGMSAQANQILLGLHAKYTGKKEVKPEPPSAPRTPVTRGSNVVAEHPAILKREILEPSNQVALQRLTNTVLDESMARGLAGSETVKPESIEPA